MKILRIWENEDHWMTADENWVPVFWASKLGNTKENLLSGYEDHTIVDYGYEPPEWAYSTKKVSN